MPPLSLTHCLPVAACHRICALCCSRNSSNFFFFFPFSPHFLEMTHFNGTMKNCNGFSTPTKQPTSRHWALRLGPGEGSCLDKAVRKHGSAAAVRSPGWTLELHSPGRDAAQAAKIHLEVYFLTTNVSAGRGVHCLSDLLRSIDACFLKWAVASESACGFPW